MSIINSDEMFENWKNIMGEIRRISLGKYNGPGNDFNLTKQIPIYCGPDKCHHKFNFLLEGNLCNCCNTLSYLYNDGKITNAPIVIEHGEHKGEVIAVKENSKNMDVNFGSYTRKRFDFDKLRTKLPPVTAMHSVLDTHSDQIFMVNVDSHDSHYVVISSLAEMSTISPGRFLSCYICNANKIIKRVPEHVGSFKGITLSSKEALSILTRCIMTTMEDNFVQGGPDIRRLSFNRANGVARVGSVKLNTECNVFLEPTKTASFHCEGYENKKIKFIGKDSENVTEDDLLFIPADVKIAKDKDLKSFTKVRVNNPSIKSYDDNSIVVVRPTESLFEFVEKTGILIFPTLYLYMWYIVLLCEKPFYDAFVDKHSGILRAFIFTDERDVLLEEVRKWHYTESPTYEQCKELMIKLGFAMRFDAIVRFSMVIQSEFKR